MRARDSQRQRVYDWEKEFVYPRDRIYWAVAAKRGTRAHIPENEARAILLSLEECQKIVGIAYGRAGRYPSPKVTDGRGRRRGGSNPFFVKLPLWTRFPAMVLHEAAHYSKKPEGPAHGPEFVARLIEFLVTIEGHDLSFLLRSARSSGVKVADRNYHQWQEAAGPTQS